VSIEFSLGFGFENGASVFEKHKINAKINLEKKDEASKFQY